VPGLGYHRRVPRTDVFSERELHAALSPERITNRSRLISAPYAMAPVHRHGRVADTRPGSLPSAFPKSGSSGAKRLRSGCPECRARRDGHWDQRKARPAAGSCAHRSVQFSEYEYQRLASCDGGRFSRCTRQTAIRWSLHVYAPAYERMKSGCLKQLPKQRASPGARMGLTSHEAAAGEALSNPPAPAMAAAAASLRKASGCAHR